MAPKRTKRATKKVRNLSAKKVGKQQASEVRGGEIVISKDTDKDSKKLL